MQGAMKSDARRLPVGRDGCERTSAPAPLIELDSPRLSGGDPGRSRSYSAVAARHRTLTGAR
jgi:hypothetical protein